MWSSRGLEERRHLSASLPEIRIGHQANAPSHISEETCQSVSTYPDFSPRNSLARSSSISDLQRHVLTLGHNRQARHYSSMGLYSNSSASDIALAFPPIRPISLYPSPPSSNSSTTSVKELSFNECRKASATLMCYRMRGVHSKPYAKAAIDSLVKKLKKKPDDLNSILSALRTNGNQPSGCVLIRRSQDGKLQFEGLRDYAHIVYVRIWRWPEVQEYQLTHIKSCHYGFSLNFNSLCVNPYHYKKILPLSQESIASPDAPNQLDPLLDLPNRSSKDLPGPSETSTMISKTPLVGSMLPQTNLSPRLNQLHRKSFTPQAISPEPVLHDEDIDPLLPDTQPSGASFVHNRPPSKYWCSVSYFELDNQVGETFNAPSALPSITIDGFVNPSVEDHFCLGALSNLWRTEQIQETRLHIGSGVRFERKQNGDVWLRCLSDCSVFIQSCYLDLEAGKLPGEAVHKVYPRTYVKVFDFNQLRSVIQYHVARLKALSSSPMASIGTDDFIHFCKCRVSFVKGWSDEYERESIEQTPCWIEVNFHRAFRLLDEILCTTLFQDRAPNRYDDSYKQTSNFNHS